MDKALVPLTEKVESLVYDMDTIKGQLKLVFQMTKDTKIPLPLKESIFLTFQCKICQSLMVSQSFFQSAVGHYLDVFHVLINGIVGLMA